MTHLKTIAPALGLGAMLLGGCASHGPVADSGAAARPEVTVDAQVDDTIALAAIRQSIAAETDEPAVFHLGAGDALGRAVFVTYVAHLRQTRDDMRFATGASDQPE